MTGVPATAAPNSTFSVRFILRNGGSATLKFRYSPHFAVILSHVASLNVENGPSVGTGAFEAPLTAELRPGEAVAGSAQADLDPCGWNGVGEAPPFPGGEYQLRVRGAILAADPSTDETNQTPQATITSKPYRIRVGK